MLVLTAGTSSSTLESVHIHRVTLLPTTMETSFEQFESMVKTEKEKWELVQTGCEEVLQVLDRELGYDHSKKRRGKTELLLFLCREVPSKGLLFASLFRSLSLFTLFFNFSGPKRRAPRLDPSERDTGINQGGDSSLVKGGSKKGMLGSMSHILSTFQSHIDELPNEVCFSFFFVPLFETVAGVNISCNKHPSIFLHAYLSMCSFRLC